MPWKPGQSGNPAGRKPGQVNRLSMEFREKMEAACQERGFDLVGSLVEVAADPNHEDSMAARKVLCDYAYPKLKAVEATVVEPVRVVMVDASASDDDPLG